VFVSVSVSVSGRD